VTRGGRDPENAPRPSARGVQLLQDPRWNRGTGFTHEERTALALEGLLPPRVQSIQQQLDRVLDNLRRKPDDLERYIGLIALQDRNETLFYRLVIDHLPQIMPLIYTPTVGAACEAFGSIFRRPRGLYISALHRGRIREVVANWPGEARMIVVTDGERILGLGDLGADGMGIPIGKLSLYTAAAGIDPHGCLPIMFDVGTESDRRLGDPLYLGIARRRLRGDEYDELFEELVTALSERFPTAVIQMEDFARGNAFRLLDRYRGRLCLFNDDIQGTGSVVAAGLGSALRIVGRDLTDCRVLFVGAGEAATGTADTIVAMLVAGGMDESEARRRCWFVDSQGLVIAGRAGLNAEKRRYAQPHPPVHGLEAAIQAVRPHALLGASGTPGIFSRTAVESMAMLNERPIVFALSNPTSKAECTAEQAYSWSGGRAIFASGSPFDPVRIGGRTLVPGQANNAYVFPGVGLGLIASAARTVPDACFLAATRALSDMTTEEDRAQGRVFPPLERIREVSRRVAAATAEAAIAAGVAGCDPGMDVDACVRDLMWEPSYDCPLTWVPGVR